MRLLSFWSEEIDIISGIILFSWLMIFRSLPYVSCSGGSIPKNWFVSVIIPTINPSSITLNIGFEKISFFVLFLTNIKKSLVSSYEFHSISSIHKTSSPTSTIILDGKHGINPLFLFLLTITPITLLL